MNFRLVALIMLTLSLMSCTGDFGLHNETASGVHKEPYFGIWCPMDHGKAMTEGGDSLFVFTESSMYFQYTFVVRKSFKKNYDATYYEVDSLNPLYNVVDSNPNVKLFFDGMAFKMKPEQVIKLEQWFDQLFNETGTESEADQLDGSNIYVTRRGQTKRVNTGPMVEKWGKYSIFLRDSVVRPMRELRKRVRQEAKVRSNGI